MNPWQPIKSPIFWCFSIDLHSKISTFIFLSLCFSTTFAVSSESESIKRKTPNGLALILAKDGGMGHGFIIDDTLYSSGHVLEFDIEMAITFQGESWVNITSLLAGKPILHPKYFEATEALSTLDTNVRSKDLIPFFNDTLRLPFDMGYIKLSQRLKSHFELSRASTILELEQHLATIDNKYEASIATSMTPKIVTFQSTVNDFYPASISFNSSLQDVTIGIGKSQNPVSSNDMFIENDIQSEPGMSGTPLFIDSKSNDKLVVLGIFNGVAPGLSGSLTEVIGVENSAPNLFNSVTELNKWLQPPSSINHGFAIENPNKCNNSLE